MGKVIFFFVISAILDLGLSGSEMYHNFFSAAKEADSFLVVKINEKRQTITEYMLPRNAILPNNRRNTELFAVPRAGTFIFPLKSGELLSFHFPNINVENPEKTYSLLMRFKQLETEDEAAFLISNLLDYQSDMRFAALKRMQEIGYFNRSFTPNTLLFFKEFYTNEKISVQEKRLLLESFANCNFNQMQDVYILALSDRSVAKTAGKILHEKNRILFTGIINEYISNEKLWMTALWQSEFFVDDGYFVSKAMEHFKWDNPHSNSPDFIPLLFSTTGNQSDNDEMIKKLLTDSRNTKSFQLYRVLAYWLNQGKTDKFKHEIMQFLVNNKRNHYISDSIIYPTMLSALKKTEHPQADSMLLEYLENLKERNNKQLNEQVCILFKKKGHPTPTLDELISTQK